MPRRIAAGLREGARGGRSRRSSLIVDSTIHSIPTAAGMSTTWVVSSVEIPKMAFQWLASVTTPLTFSSRRRWHSKPDVEIR